MTRRWQESAEAIAELRAVRWGLIACLALWLLIIAAAASAAGWAIVVDRGYDGAVIVVDQGMVTMRYTGGLLLVEVVDRTRDGIFRSSFGDAPGLQAPAECDGRCL